jgi:uracil phosphoribosyltransferase
MKSNLCITLFVVAFCTAVQSADKTLKGAPAAKANSVVVLKHPLAEHYLSIMRDRNTKSDEFRNALKRISEWLFSEATMCLPTVSVNTRTPVGWASCRRLNPKTRIVVAPILRAGVGMMETALSLIPNAVVHMLGMSRDEKTHKPRWYYNRVPETFGKQKTIVFVCDTVVATGYSIIAAVNEFKRRGINEEDIHIICVIISRDGAERILNEFPKIKITAASMDLKLNEKCYIVPGLGDAGDRIFNTVDP